MQRIERMQRIVDSTLTTPRASRELFLFNSVGTRELPEVAPLRIRARWARSRKVLGAIRRIRQIRHIRIPLHLCGRPERLAVGLLVCATSLNAQQAVACSGPGAAFGVTAYQCASCSIKQRAGVRTQYVFQAEPVVLEVSTSSVLRPGDVIEAVNGEPIMTQAGSDRFTYPSAGPVVITVRRGNARSQLNAIAPVCSEKPPIPSQPLFLVDGKPVDDFKSVDPRDIENVEVLKGAAAAVYGQSAISGVVVITTKKAASQISPRRELPELPTRNEPIYVIDGVVQTNVSPTDMNDASGGARKFGFAIGCSPSCTRVTARDGSEYFKFDGYPSIVALTPGGAAERAGVRVGDLVSQIDGKAITGEEGALRFMRGNKSETLHLTVIRDRATIGYVLTAR